MPEPITSVVKSIKDSHSAQVRIFTTSGEEIFLDCVYKEDVAPHFFLAFPPKIIPENLDISRSVPIALKGAQPPLTINANIEEVHGDRTLYLTATEALDPTTLREFFRVDLNAKIIANFEPLDTDDEAESWEVTGETIDVSGTGILAIFNKELKSTQGILLDIYLDYYKEYIKCEAHIVKMTRLRKEKYRVAFHIDKITPKNRDKIITCCLHEQRKLLRERVQI